MSCAPSKEMMTYCGFGTACLVIAAPFASSLPPAGLIGPAWTELALTNDADRATQSATRQATSMDTPRRPLPLCSNCGGGGEALVHRLSQFSPAPFHVDKFPLKRTLTKGAGRQKAGRFKKK